MELVFQTYNLYLWFGINDDDDDNTDQSYVLKLR